MPKSNEELAMEFCIIMRSPVKDRFESNYRLGQIKQILDKRIGGENALILIKNAGDTLKIVGI